MINSSRCTISLTGFFIWILLAFSCRGNKEVAIENTIKNNVKSRIVNDCSVGTAVVFFNDGKEEYFTYGFTDSTHRHPITKKSVFEIGSISKTFTSLLLADLIIKGKLKADDPVENYLPDSLKIPSFMNTRITFADLASHTSGLPRMPDNIVLRDADNPLADYTDDKLYNFLGSYHLDRARGKYNYSNLGVGLLGNVVSRIYGKTYEKALQDVICKPLGLAQTNTLNTSPFLTTPHSGTLAVSRTDLASISGAGAIRSNAEDMLRYLKFQMGILDSPLHAAMKLTRQPLDDAYDNVKIGMGWHIIPTETDTIIWHNGATAGYRTFVGFALKSKRAIIILNNSTKSPDDLGMYYFNQTKPIEAVKMPVNIASEVLKDKVGIYKVTTIHDSVKPDSEIQIMLQQGQLYCRLSQEPWINLLPESESQFFTRMEHQIRFVRNTQGRIESIKVRFPYGVEISATRLNNKFPLPGKTGL